MRFPRYLPLLYLTLAWTFCYANPAAAAGDDWLPVDVNDPALKAPVVEAEADAEGIFWDVVLDDAAKDGLALNNYVRVKVFNDRGAASQSRIDIPYRGSDRIEAIAARTIKPDGSIVELNPQDIFDRVVVRVSKVKVKVKSFVLPGVQAGAILEYRWREVFPRQFAYYIRLPFQRDIPTRRITYHFRQNPRIPNAAMRMAYFHMPPIRLVPEPNSFYSVTMDNVPAFHEEPRMPPEDEVRSWMLVYYVFRGDSIGNDYWRQISKVATEVFQPYMKGNADTQRAATEAIGNATSPDEKLQRLFSYCRNRIKNVRSADSGMNLDDLQRRKRNKTPSDTLKASSGSGFEINMLFAAMAAAAGFDARVALSGDRSDKFFDRAFPDVYFLSSLSIAIKVADTWRFFDPGALYAPYGMLTWQAEGQSTLIADPANLIFARTPMSPPDASMQTQKATLRLTEDGTLEGDVRIEYTGHLAAEMKAGNDDASPAKREQNLREALKTRLSTAEASEIRVENATDPGKPFVYVYHVRVPDYAQRAGKRIFLQPAFFEHGVGSVFSTSSRTNDLHFNYPWSELDEVIIELPKGYELDAVDAIRPYNFGKTSEYKASIVPREDGRAITYRRSFSFGANELIFFLVGDYGGLKNYFDVIQQRNDYTITLKQTPATSNQVVTRPRQPAPRPVVSLLATTARRSPTHLRRAE